MERWTVICVLLVIVNGLVDVWVVVSMFSLCIGCLCCWLRGVCLFLCAWEAAFWFCWCVSGFGSVVVGAFVRVVGWGLQVLFPWGVLWGMGLGDVNPMKVGGFAMSSKSDVCCCKCLG